MKIQVLWFNDSILLSKGCVPIRSLSNGDKVDGGTVTIEPYDNLFVKLSYAYKDAAKNYCENIPWSRCDKVIFVEKPAGKSSKA